MIGWNWAQVFLGKRWYSFAILLLVSPGMQALTFICMNFTQWFTRKNMKIRVRFVFSREISLNIYFSLRKWVQWGIVQFCFVKFSIRQGFKWYCSSQKSWQFFFKFWFFRMLATHRRERVYLAYFQSSCVEAILSVPFLIGKY